MSTNRFFDEQKWHRVATQNHDWYKIIYPELEVLWSRHEGADVENRNIVRNAVYGFFETLLDEGKVVLGSEGKDWDAERKPIDTIVIHHTKGEGGMTRSRLDAMHLLRLYAKSYLKPSTEKEIQGLPVWSNHFRNERESVRMCFYAYHWLVRRDGSVERLLADDEIGWHAGNWDINCRSVGICLDGDFEHSAPPEAMIEGAKNLIREHYPAIATSRIIPHHVANPQTTCPGQWFLRIDWSAPRRYDDYVLFNIN